MNPRLMFVILLTALTSLGSGTREAAVHAERLDQAKAGGAEVHITEIAPRVQMLSIPAANALVVGHETGCTYIGVQTPALVAASKTVEGCTSFRYVVITEDDAAPKLGDGGWGQTGALTVAHERLYRRMRPFAKAGEAVLPAVGFSQVMQLWLKGEEIHIVHAESAYSDADVIVHLEDSGVLFTGNQFTSDGYPSLRLDRGGSVSQMIEWVDYFIRNYDGNYAQYAGMVEPIVPGRGPLATMRDLREFSAMLIVVNRRVADWMARPWTLKRILEGEPTKEFDARWGKGPVSPAMFVTQVYESLLKAQQKAAPAPAPAGHDHAIPGGGKPQP